MTSSTSVGDKIQFYSVLLGMKFLKLNILLCGKSITQDHALLEMLKNKFSVSRIKDTNKLINAVREQKFSLIVFEFSDQWEQDLYLVQKLKMTLPEIPIIVVGEDESSDVVVKAYQAGAIDYFKKPYEISLLAERVEALTKS